MSQFYFSEVRCGDEELDSSLHIEILESKPQAYKNLAESDYYFVHTYVVSLLMNWVL